MCPVLTLISNTMSTHSNAIQNISNQFKEQFGSSPQIIVRAPGRVNLIGEHTDYNDGFVFPAAIEQEMLIAISVRSDRQVRAWAGNLNSSSTFSLDQILHAACPNESWSNYLRAMASVLTSEGLELPGMNCLTIGNVPVASGLSSSAAFLVAAGLAFSYAAGEVITGVPLALLAQIGEREFVGVNVGIMDQFISVLGKRDHALLIDTRSLTYESVPLPQTGAVIVIADTGKRRGLVDSEYNARRAECEQAVELLQGVLPGITALRDVTLNQLNEHAKRLPELTLKRARHVVSEDLRTLDGVSALKRGDLARFGKMMNGSHNSLRDYYQVSCSELDSMVTAALTIEGVYGSRMTGAGFGGCAVSLVAEGSVDRFLSEVPKLYISSTGLTPTLYVSKAGQGAERLL